MSIYIKHMEGKGKGVFTDERIPEHQIIEIAPVLVFDETEWKCIGSTLLGEYCYLWGSEFLTGAIALGYGSLYNHSYQPNAKFVRFPEQQEIHFIALREIQEGEEITINYNGENIYDPVWFEVVE